MAINVNTSEADALTRKFAQLADVGITTSSPCARRSSGGVALRRPDRPQRG
jgi:hypothetical protein